jgi:hypothetical protein
MIDPVDDAIVERIAGRVVDLLRAEIETLIGEVVQTNATAGPLTVDQVANRFGVARSTVYAHWREWGGYKLGESPTAPIRFNDPPHRPPTKSDAMPEPRSARRRRRRSVLDGVDKLPLAEGMGDL